MDYNDNSKTNSYENLSLQQSHSYVYYYLHDNHFTTLLPVCQFFYNRYNDPFFVFWRAFAIFKSGLPSQAVNELQQISNMKEIQWATTKASILYHRKCDPVDDRTVDQLEMMEPDFERNARERDIVAGCFFLMFLSKEEGGDVEWAKDILGRTRFDGPSIEVCRGWCEIKLGENGSLAAAKNHFQEALNQDQDNIEAMMGLARISELAGSNNLHIYQNYVNDILLTHNDYAPGLIEKCRMNLIIKDYDSLKESIRELVKVDKHSIHAYQYWTFYDLCHVGNLDDARDRFERLHALIQEKESNNYELLLFTGTLMSRICGRASSILDICIRMLTKANKIRPLSPKPMIELGNCYFMINQLPKAKRYFEDAAGIDLESLDPMVGILKTMIAQDKFGEAEMQLEFLIEMSKSIGGDSSQVTFIEGVLLGRKETGRKNFGSMEEKLKASNKALDKSLSLHIAPQKSKPQNLEFYVMLNPDYLLSLANEFLYHSDFTLSQIKDRILNPTTPTHLVKKATKLLSTTLKKIPGLIPAYMISAKAKLIMGDMNGALMSLQKALEYDPKNEEAHILYAIIVYSNGNMESAYGSIKEALANNFDIDKNPFFMLIKGQIEFESGSTEDGLKTLKKAYELPGVQESEERNEQQQNRFMTVIEFNDNIRAQIFVYYAMALAKSKENSQAKEVMENAIMEFAGTEDEPVVLLGNADIALLSSDLKKAIDILKNVEPNAKGYMEARKKLADIYLNEMKQRRQYAKCYQDLAETFPTFENLKLYGDALMKIQEPHDAIEAYNRALSQEPDNKQMLALVGRAMSTTHDYQGTNDYYERVLTENRDFLEMQIDYANLLVKNNHLERAEILIDLETIMSETEEPNLANIKKCISALKIFASIAKKKIEMEIDENQQAINVLEYWKKIITKQFEAIERAKYDAGNPDVERKLYADYCEELGNLYVDIDNDLENAKEQFQEAYKYNPNKSSLLLEIAEVNFLLQNVEDAQTNCTKVLRHDPTNPWALRLLGECLTYKGEINQGIVGFTKVYNRDQTNFTALGQLFMFMRRAGQLDKVKELLEKTEEKFGKDNNEPGLCFCRGLYQYFRKNPKQALIEFQKSLRNRLYSSMSIRYMIDIYLNPEQELYYTCEGNRVYPIVQDNIESIEVLLDELDYKHFYAEKAVYNTYCNVILRQEYDDSETFLDTFLQENANFTPAMLCLCFTRMCKNKTVDKQLLKEITKLRMNPRWGDDSERAWLHVADFLIHAKMYERAENLLKKCLKVNKSSMKALEMLGQLYEKQENYDSAARFYNLAWDISEKRNCQIGYRIASLQFKAQNWISSITIAKQVLSINSSFPKIKEDIIAKARTMIKRSINRSKKLLKIKPLVQPKILRPFSLCKLGSVNPNPVNFFKNQNGLKWSLNRSFAAENKQEPEINLFPEVCYYKTLNLSTNATFPQIKSAYLKLAKKLHPDVSKDPKAKLKFPLLSEAYKILTNPKQRKIYDEVIGISDPTWSEDARFNPEFENNDEFMDYVKGDRNYDDERRNIDYSFEEKNAEDLYDYFRAKHLGGYGMRQDSEEESEHFGGRKFSGSTSPLGGMNGLDMEGEGVVNPSSSMAFHMKTDKQLREVKRKRVEDNDYILFSQNRHDAYYASKEEHAEHKNVGLTLLKEFRVFGILLIAGVYFIYSQIQPSGRGKLTGKNDSSKLKQKNIDKGLGVKDKITPI